MSTTTTRRMCKLVRDLEWVFQSPQMIQHDMHAASSIQPVCDTFLRTVVQQSQSWLTALKHNPQPLLDWMLNRRCNKNKSDLTLGIYYGYLIEYWLTHCPLLASENRWFNIPLFRANDAQTVGQLKFLFSYQKECWHWESSVKFFLSVKNTKSTPIVEGDLARYVGPDLGENLAWRFNETRRKLNLSQLQVVKDWLGSKGMEQETVPGYLLKGYLFYPLADMKDTITFEPETHTNSASRDVKVSANHGRGWYTQDIMQVGKKCISPSSRFVIMDKLHWLCPVQGYVNSQAVVVVDGVEGLGIPSLQAMTADDLEFHLTQKDNMYSHLYKFMIAELVPTCDGKYKEVSRGFLLPDQWDPAPMCHTAVRVKSKTSSQYVPFSKESGVHEVVVERPIKRTTIVEPTTSEILESFPSADASSLVSNLPLQLFRNDSVPFKCLQRRFRAKVALQQDAYAFLLNCFTVLVETSLGEGALDPKKISRMGHFLAEGATQQLHSSLLQKESFCKLLCQLITMVTTHPENNTAVNLCRVLLKVDPVLGKTSYESSDDVTQSARDCVSRVLVQLPSLAERRVLSATLLDCVLTLVDVFNVVVLDTSARNCIEKLIALGCVREAKKLVGSSFGKSLSWNEFVDLLWVHEQYQSAQKYSVTSFPTKNAGHVFPEQNGTGEALTLSSTSYDMTFVQCESSMKNLWQTYQTFLTSDRKMPKIVAIDCEWRPSFMTKLSNGVRPPPVSVLQLAFEKKVYVVDLQSSVVVREMQSFLPSLIHEQSGVWIAGFGVEMDIRRLVEQFVDVLLPPGRVDSKIPILELQQMIVGKAKNSFGLASLYKAVFNKYVKKKEQCSDWYHRPLSQVDFFVFLIRILYTL